MNTKGAVQMIEQAFPFAKGNEKTIERLIDDAHVAINHIILPMGSGLPEHHSNSNIYMVVVRGTMTLKLDDQEAHTYVGGHIVAIPYQVKMNISNLNEDVLEFFVLKSPNPRDYPK
jgi:quercetin dioxygenase-like cupin family protein